MQHIDHNRLTNINTHTTQDTQICIDDIFFQIGTIISREKV